MVLLKKIWFEMKRAGDVHIEKGADMNMRGRQRKKSDHPNIHR